MTRPMRLRDVVKALNAQGCSIRSDDGAHTKWACPCGRHTANIPRHCEISPGVVRDTIRRLEMPAGGVAGVKTYQATAKKWEGGWELHIAGIGVTQSRTLRDAERMVRSYVALDTGLDRNAFDVEIVPELGGLEARVKEIRTAAADAAKVQREAADLTRNVVRELRGQGLSGNDIAALLKVSPQRVSQILRSGAASTTARGRVTTGRSRRLSAKAARMESREAARKR